MSARFNSWLWSQNKRKVDAELPAAREEQNWYSVLSVHNTPDSNFCVNYQTYIYSLISRTQKYEFQSKRCLEMDSRAFFLIQRQLIIYLFELITTFSRSRSRSHFFINSAEPDPAFFNHWRRSRSCAKYGRLRNPDKSYSWWHTPRISRNYPKFVGITELSTLLKHLKSMHSSYHSSYAHMSVSLTYKQ